MSRSNKLSDPFPWVLRIRQRFTDAGGSAMAFDECLEHYKYRGVQDVLSQLQRDPSLLDELCESANLPTRGPS